MMTTKRRVWCIRAGSVLLLFALLVCLTGCYGFIDKEDAKACFGELLTALSQDDYEAAEACLHPSLLSALDASVKDAFSALEQQAGVDFSAGTSVKKYTGIHTYAGTGKATYQMTAILLIGGSETECTFTVLKDKAGFGISEFRLQS